MMNQLEIHLAKFSNDHRTNKRRLEETELNQDQTEQQVDTSNDQEGNNGGDTETDNLVSDDGDQ